MKEIIRLENIFADDLLNEYYLSVYENEIVYVQSLSYRSLHVLAELLSCQKDAQAGVFVINRQKYSSLTPELLIENGIYTAMLGSELIPNLSAAENLSISMYPLRQRKFYSHHQAEKEAAQACAAYGIDIDVTQPVWKLTMTDLRKLSILRAKMMNMRLVILELTSGTDEGYHQQEIVALIRRLYEEGMSFLILASRYTPIISIATRFQHIRYGMAVKEWMGPDLSVSRALMHQENIVIPESSASEDKTFIGLYDSEWTDEGNIWQYLYQVKENLPQLWQEKIGCELPEEYVSCNGRTAVIPRTSYNELLENESIAANLTIALKNRIAAPAGIIRKNLENRLETDFRREFQVDENAKHVMDLSRLQRKILSIERFVLTKPDVIILEDPYRSVHVSEVGQLRAYMKQLSRRGIRIIYYSRSTSMMVHDCFEIIETHNCKK